MSKTFLWILKIIITISILMILIYTIDVSEIQSAFLHLQPVHVGLAFSLLPLNFLLQILKWQILIRPITSATFQQSTTSVLGGYALMLITPGRSGELGRALFFNSDRKLFLAGMVVVDKGFASFTMLLFAALSVALWYGGMYWGFVVVAILICLLLIRFPIIFNRVLEYISRKIYKKPLLDELTQHQIILALVYSILFFLTYAFQFFLLINAFEPVSFRVWLIAFPWMMFVNAFAFTIGGLGIRETGAVLAFAHFGCNPASAMSASLLLYAINILLPGIISIPLLWKVRLFSHQS